MSAAIQTKLKVLVAERSRTMAGALARVIDDSFGAVAAAVSDATQALEIGTKIAPDVAVIDLALSPNCELVTGLHKACPDTRIIVLAERDGSEAEAMVKALAAGAVGAIYKESSLESLARALESSSRATPVITEEASGVLLGSYVDALSEKRARDLATIQALATAVEARDVGTGRHLRRVTELATRCLERIDLDLAGNEEVSYGFMLHDVGKVGIPDAVLNKPGPLDAREWATMRKHPEIGLDIVQPIGFSKSATDVILFHHERWDGGGYPLKLSGEQIPVVARTFSIADAFDAMTSDRPYHEAMRPEDVLEVIALDSGHRFDPDIVNTFVDLVRS
ncbi:MAG TPA: HD domain-containing phosphohydrolase [Actinomycetota bacterium]|nr:HD domain-containing phosphohydrolase [Actinomycetota bacterium]